MTKKDIQIIKGGIEAVRALIDESVGVAGLHLNGDLATWGELEEGGWMEAWLLPFNMAEDKIKDIAAAYSDKKEAL